MADFDFGPGNDVENGTNKSDNMNGNGGDDTLDGLAGNDNIFGGDGDDELIGGKGNDFLSGEANNDVLVGGVGNDTLFGGTGRDVLKGGGGIDFLNGNAGNAKLFGGSGVDNFQVDEGAGRVFIMDFEDDVDNLNLDGDFFPGLTIDQILTKHGSSSGGDSAIDLSRKGNDSPRLILIGVDNIFDMSDDITLL